MQLSEIDIHLSIIEKKWMQPILMPISLSRYEGNSETCLHGKIYRDAYVNYDFPNQQGHMCNLVYHLHSAHVQML